MMTSEEALKYGLSFPGTYEDITFGDCNWKFVRVAGSKKAFLWIYERDGLINLDVRVSLEWGQFWRETYEAVIPGWHQNNENWNTIILDGTILDEDIKRMIAASYDRVRIPILNEGIVWDDNRRVNIEKLIFRIGGVFEPYQRTEIWSENGEFYKRVVIESWGNDKEKEILSTTKFTPEEMRYVSVIKSYNIYDWKEEYYDSRYCDGTSWSLTYKEFGKECKKIYGQNAFPNCWDSFIRMFNDCVRNNVL